MKNFWNKQNDLDVKSNKKKKKNNLVHQTFNYNFRKAVVNVNGA